MPNKTGRFHLYSDTSKFATGSALYQIQNGKSKLVAYMSKRLPEATKSYSITELELCGLAINIATPGSSWHEKEFRSLSKTQNTTYFTQRRKYGKATCRSGKSWIKKKET